MISVNPFFIWVFKTKEFWAPIATIKESPRKKPVKKAGNIMAN